MEKNIVYHGSNVEVVIPRILQNSREAFWKLVKFNYPTHQIVFCTEEALKTLKYKGSRVI